VLLKARLHEAHWTLTVKDASKTNRKKHENCDFESPSPVETIRRIDEVVGIAISDKDRSALLALAKTRNALQHWGLTESAPAVESRAAAVLDFLISFLDDHLLEGLSEKDRADMNDDLLLVRSGLRAIKAYVTTRLQRLEEELEDKADPVVMCPECSQFTLLVKGSESKCYFCARSWNSDELTQAYVSEIMNVFARDLAKAGDYFEAECPDCASETFVLGVITSTDVVIDLCFNCAHLRESG
jgi:hypothetical protein